MAVGHIDVAKQTISQAILAAVNAAAQPDSIGTFFAIKKTVLQSNIVAAGIDLTTVSTGLLELMEVILQNGATACTSAGGTAVLEIDNNNVNGEPVVVTAAEALLLANVTLPSGIGGAWSSSAYPFVLENGKKLTAKATSEDFTSAGNTDIYLVFRRLAVGATIAAA